MKRELPNQFIRSRLNLTWTDVLVGLEEAWLNPSFAIDLAMENVIHSDSEVEIELAGLVPSQYGNVLLLVRRLADETQLEQSRLRWMRLMMAWLFHNRHEFEEPLEIIEQEIYPGFGYPEEIRHLVRYESTFESIARGKNVMLRNWRSYLTDTLGFEIDE